MICGGFFVLTNIQLNGHLRLSRKNFVSIKHHCFAIELSRQDNSFQIIFAASDLMFEAVFFGNNKGLVEGSSSGLNEIPLVPKTAKALLMNPRC